jgi:GT2 family glycosyltransferase
VETGGNLGFPVACNRGAAAGGSDVIVLLNNDVDARPDFLQRLVAPLAGDERVGSASALLVKPNNTTIDSVGLAVDSTLAGFPRHHGLPIPAARNSRPRLLGPSGGAGAYRREAWTEVHGLDENVFFYLEDLDLALRLRSRGWQAVAVPEAVGTHHGSATMGQRSTWQRYQAGFSRGYFLRRYGVIARRTAFRALTTEAAVVVGDFVLSRDFVATRSRFDGWKSAAHSPRRPYPPADAVDSSISFIESMRLRAKGVGAASG